MEGLRTQENAKFLKYWDIVQNSARKENMTFFLDCGEGNEFENDYINCEDLSGWLIHFSDVNDFKREFERNKTISERWNDFITFVKWSRNGEDFVVEFISAQESC